MDALVEQLRRDAYAPHFTSVGAANLMLKAADEIERLRAAVAAEREACANLAGGACCICGNKIAALIRSRGA